MKGLQIKEHTQMNTKIMEISRKRFAVRKIHIKSRDNSHTITERLEGNDAAGP